MLNGIERQALHFAPGSIGPESIAPESIGPGNTAAAEEQPR